VVREIIDDRDAADRAALLQTPAHAAEGAQTLAHPLGIGPFKDFNVGPFPHPGADQTVRNASFYHNAKDPFRTAEGPVLRHIMDLGKPDSALMAIDGSESGKWLDPHYKDMHAVWFNGKYLTATMDDAQVKKEAKSKLVLEP
jgi:penicillin amidase